MGKPSTIDHKAVRTREPGLDLLRSIAIISVVVFHMQLKGTPRFLRPVQDLGWIGVDLFFVLSGYLISSQLLRPYARSEVFSVRIFFLRRAFRVLPAFLVVLALYLSFSTFRERPNLPDFWRFLTFTMNFGLQAPAAFSHAWSLCVEEHFYLVFPFLVLWLMRKPNLWESGGDIDILGRTADPLGDLSR
jgi:peptidoglycan/LPS O-acetylase OafA/YrhL